MGFDSITIGNKLNTLCRSFLLPFSESEPSKKNRY
jgi:hypothetical protein